MPDNPKKKKGSNIIYVEKILEKLKIVCYNKINVIADRIAQYERLDNSMIKMAVIGFGNIGSGLVQLITENAEVIEKDLGCKLEIKYIVDIRDFKGHPLESKIVKDFNVVLEDPEVSIVAEMIGGSHPAFDFSLAALKAGKSVVTSNKEVVANFGEVLLKAAKENKVAYLFEAAVGGAIPIIRPMRESLSSDVINEINGILNGTTNFILTKMLSDGMSFDDALRLSRDLGYAEANPSADVDGIDSCRKIAILSALAYGKVFSCDKISTQGIRNISRRDAEDAAKMSCAIKLIAHTEKMSDGKILIDVAPKFTEIDSPLYSVSDVFNGILISAKASGDLMFYGRGAGKIPTAGAVLADIAEIVKHISIGQIPPVLWERAEDAELFDSKQQMTRFYCRVKGDKTPEGVNIISSKDGETSFVTAVTNEYETEKMLENFVCVSKIRFM